MRKLKFNKFGLIEDPRGGHCIMFHEGRELLGRITDVVRNEARGFTFLKVVHMNGEPWPIQPAALAVNILERNR